MNRRYEVGITGGIGSGKSTVCRVFQSFGIPVYDADSRAKTLMTTDQILIFEIKKEFGSSSYDNLGKLNRAHLAATVFGDPDRLAQLNKLVHPRVKLDYDAWLQQQKGAPYVIREAAILLQHGRPRPDFVVVVTASRAVRLARIQARDPQRSVAQIEQIMNQQLQDDTLVALADVVINNDEFIPVLPQILTIHQQLLKLANQPGNEPGTSRI